MGKFISQTQFWFADYRNFIRQYKDRFTFSLEVDRHELTDALERIFVFNTELNKATFFGLAPEELALHCQGQDVGEGRELIGCRYSGRTNAVLKIGPR